jgi:hypothetical protein
MSPNFLSKSRYMNGLQCLKLLWLVYHQPEKVPGPDASTRRIFDQGHLVGELAKKLFPGGIDIPADNFKGNLDRTRQLLAARKPLFEAGFLCGGLYSRLDILNPVGRSQWDIIEVKSSTSLKRENLSDVSFQKLCAEKAGLEINRCYLAFINNQYVRQGEIDPAQFFTVQDITEEVTEAAAGIDQRIAGMFEIMAAKTCPDISIGACCSDPYDCPVTCCWEELPENNIFSLYRGGKKCFDLFYGGILNIRDIPAQVKLNRSQEIQKWCDINQAPHIESQPLRDFLRDVSPPVHYLDFETINPAVPLFDGVRPYQQVPFQFSLHIADGLNMRHFSFLADGPEDPRPGFLRRLKESIGPAGSIVTYNQSFEEGILKDLAQAYPGYGQWMDGVRSRLVDLYKPFQSFQFYHPQQNGSASIKHVLPALTGKGYEGMAIADGGTASQAFLDVTYGQATPEERCKVRADLEKYCGLDTEGMVWIVDKLKDICRYS